MTPREIFEADGRLSKCPNPPHDFQIGRVVGSWSWAKDAWSTLSDTGFMHTDYVSVGRTEAVDGTRWAYIVVWKLSVFVAVVKEKP